MLWEGILPYPILRQNLHLPSTFACIPACHSPPHVCIGLRALQVKALTSSHLVELVKRVPIQDWQYGSRTRLEVRDPPSHNAPCRPRLALPCDCTVSLTRLHCPHCINPSLARAFSVCCPLGPALAWLSCMYPARRLHQIARVHACRDVLVSELKRHRAR